MENIGPERKMSESELTPEEIKEMKNMLIELEEFKRNAEENLKKYSDDCNKLLAEVHELKEKNTKLESEVTLKNDKIETLENDKKLAEQKLIEKRQSEDLKINDFYNEIRNLESQLEESKLKNKEEKKEEKKEQKKEEDKKGDKKEEKKEEDKKEEDNKEEKKEKEKEKNEENKSRI